MSTDWEALRANLRRPVFVEDVNQVPQNLGPGNGNPMPSGWLEDDSVSTDVIQASAVIADKVAAGAITTDKLAANAVTAAKIEAGTITSNEIAANTITASNIAANTITAAEIAASAVSTSELAANAVTAAKIAANTITASEIAADAITTNELAADSVTTNKIVAANVTSSRMEVSITGKTFGSSGGSSATPGFFFDSATDTGMSFLGSFGVELDVGGSPQMTMTSLVTASSNMLRPGGDNIYPLGDSLNRWTELWAVDGTINTSDANEKQDIADAPLGLSFIQRLRPRVFRWRSTRDTAAFEDAVRALDQEAMAREAQPWVQRISDARTRQGAIRGDHPDQARLDRIVAECRRRLNEIRDRHQRAAVEAKTKRRPGRRFHYGLIAQEVKEALDAEGVDAAFWKQGPDGLQGLSYSELIAPLIRAVQQLAQRVEELEERQ